MRDALKQNSYFHIGDLPKYKKNTKFKFKNKMHSIVKLRALWFRFDVKASLPFTSTLLC